MNLLVDSAAWVALYDRGDKYHAQAAMAFRTLAEQKIIFVVTDYIVAETVTMLMYRAGHQRAVLCGDWLLHSPRVKLIRMDLDLWNEAWQLFKRYDDKDFSFTDCASFVVMRHERLRDAFTFDHHFEQAGFRLWPR
ncbi:MAG TPA: PIN domain-containing protein [Anaerolineae bacterium]|nr:PIN domain-containing protein [Anaerolineae bacterium]